MKKLMSVFLSLALVLFLSQASYAENETVSETGTEITLDVSTETEDSGSKFYDRERLTQTLLGTINNGEEPEATEEVVEVTTPEEEQASSGEEPEATEEVVEVTTPEEEQASSGEVTEERVVAFVNQLSDDQVFAMNRSLNNVVNNRLVIAYDMDLLEQIVENNYNGRQINALSKAIEEEAKFTAKYEKTGDEKFLAKAETQKERFLGKIDKFGTPEDSVDLGEEEGTPTTALVFDVKGAAKKSAKSIAKNSAKQVAKDAAKNAAKQVAKDAAKQVAKDAAKDAAKQIAKDAAKQIAKDAAKNAAKQAAKAATREARKENRGKDKKNK